jgi:hypothetical protein
MPWVTIPVTGADLRRRVEWRANVF